MTTRRVLAAALAAAVLSTAPPARADVSEKIRAQQAHLREIKARLEAKNAKLGEARAQVALAADQLAVANRNIAIANASLAELETQLRVNRKKLAWNEVQLAAAQATLHRHDEALRRRLVDAYEHGDSGYIDVLLGSTSFADFVERWNDIRYLVRANERTIRERRAAERAVAKVQLVLTADRVQLSAAEESARRKRQQLDVLEAQRQQLLAVAEDRKSEAAHDVAATEEESAAASDQIRALIAQKLAEEAAAREQERRARQLAGVAEPPASSGAPGALSWPASGPITSPFGMRTNPVNGIYRSHDGIDIGAPMGATITAAAGGKVIDVGWDGGGYGNYIVVSHGGNLATLYGHCSQIFVSNGQEVQQGQAIGAVGSTGNSTGPHLHFGVQVGSSWVDPMSYLK
jgi:murein DD-endopeptidase MepM/ murein hydrolase activator NlpD